MERQLPVRGGGGATVCSPETRGAAAGGFAMRLHLLLGCFPGQSNFSGLWYLPGDFPGLSVMVEWTRLRA